MSNMQIYHFFIRRHLPSSIAALAADIISMQQDELGESSISRLGIHQLLESFVALYELEGESALAILKENLL